jgi:hypothetical protein
VSASVYSNCESKALSFLYKSFLYKIVLWVLAYTVPFIYFVAVKTPSFPGYR